MSPDWIGADWGTSNLRVWAMSDAGDILAKAESDAGMGSLSPDQFEPALLNLINAWMSKATTVIACGMVGARQGWCEARYLSVPCSPTATALTKAPTRDPLLDVWIAPGLSQSKPADVMRGEETQIAGFLASEPDFDGVICLPGTHTKWVQISAGEVVSFQTFMSGELFALLTGHSVLKHSIAEDGWDDAAFTEAISDTLSKPGIAAAKLFSIRAEGLLGDLSPVTARARLSGLLVGLELGGARPYWLGQDIVILGNETLAQRYQEALSTQGAAARVLPSDTLTLLGLAKAYKQFRGRS